jgi:hypothetical protein
LFGSSLGFRVIEDKKSTPLIGIEIFHRGFVELFHRGSSCYVRYDQESERKMKRNGGRDGMDLAVHLREE